MPADPLIPEPVVTGRLKWHLSLILGPRRFSFGHYAPILEAGSTERGLDGLLKALEVPGKPAALKRLKADDKAEAIYRQIEHLRASPTSLWNGAHAADVLVAHFYECASRGMREVHFGAVAKENALLAPVAAYLRSRDLEVYAEIPLGRNRADVLGHKPPALWGVIDGVVVAVELKNDLTQLKRGIDQLTTFQDYAHETYLACTPAMAHEYLRWHARSPGVQSWDSQALNRKLGKIGAGLLLVEGKAVEVVTSSSSHSVTGARYREAKDQLLDARRLAAPERQLAIERPRDGRVC